MADLAPVAPASSVFLPKEHGSWSLALEPIALGLIVAPSFAGTALATAAVAGFFARRPLKATLAPAPSNRRRAAHTALVLLTACAIAGFVEALALGGVSALWPLLLAAPLSGLFVYYDAQNDARAAAAELVGSATFTLLPAAFASLADWPWPVALALSALALARSVPAVLTVRTFLRLAKRQEVAPMEPLVGGVLALGLVGYLADQQLVPGIAVGLAALLLLRTAFFVTSLRPAWPARRVGLIEAVLGVCYVGILALAYRLP